MTRVRLVSILSVDLQVEIRYEYEHDLYLNSLDRSWILFIWCGTGDNKLMLITMGLSY